MAGSKRRTRSLYGPLAAAPEPTKALANSVQLAEAAVDRIIRALALDVADAIRRQGPGPMTEAKADQAMEDVRASLAAVFGPDRKRAASGTLGREIVTQVRQGRARLATVLLQEEIAPYIADDPQLQQAMGATERDVRELQR